MKAKIKKLLQYLHLYEYIRYSHLFGIYVCLLKRKVIREERRQIVFYKSFLSHCSLIFDIGANDGHKTEAFLHIAQKVVCCEPDKKNFSTLEIRFRNQRKRVFLEQVALGSTEETAEMFIHHPGSAFNTLNEKFKRVTEADDLTKWNEKIQYHAKKEVRLTTLNNLIQKYGYPFFIKIDVEGYELEVIKGLNRPIPFISLECLLPEFAEELNQLLDLLIKLDPDSRFNIAVHEQLLFKKFVSLIEIKNFLTSFDQIHFELIVKMHSTNAQV